MYLLFLTGPCLWRRAICSLYSSLWLVYVAFQINSSSLGSGRSLYNVHRSDLGTERTGILSPRQQNGMHTTCSTFIRLLLVASSSAGARPGMLITDELLHTGASGTTGHRQRCGISESDLASKSHMLCSFGSQRSGSNKLEIARVHHLSALPAT